jgi:hypothetical protein
LSKFLPFHLFIRTKLTLPYVSLSLLIALGGEIIVTRVMIDSLKDRFTNQLIETRKLTLEVIVREENRLLETLRLLSLTEGMPAQIERDDAVFNGKLLQLIMPLFRLSAKAMDKNKRPLGTIRRDVYRGRPYQWIR